MRRCTSAASYYWTWSVPGNVQVSYFDRRSSSRTTEEQDIAVGVLELETPQAVIIVFQWFGKLDIARSKFGRQCIGIWNVKVRVPTGGRLSLVVRQWIYANVLEHDHRTASANNGEEGVLSRSLEDDLESKPVPVERKRRR